MTDKNPDNTHPDASSKEPGKHSTARNAAIGAAATIGSAAVAAALLYAGKRFLKNPDSSKTSTGQSGTVPSGEPPETD
ncbi:isopropylmalate isomerase [Qipengyuania sp. ASV99]|uniref:isopropylmalate isomerase n=1 Tax=Qipengyuania sp. ASV99 TaxID=3399681 RepID=UPI003A4C81FE